jgi:hypothetical protein
MAKKRGKKLAKKTTPAMAPPPSEGPGEAALRQAHGLGPGASVHRQAVTSTLRVGVRQGAAKYDPRVNPRRRRNPQPAADPSPAVSPAPAPPRVALEVWHQKSKNLQPFKWKSCTQDMNTCNLGLILPWM